MVLQGDEAQVDVCFGPVQDSAILKQHWCLVCVEHTTGLKNVFDKLGRTPR
jgi:hypothetical protein